MEKDLSQEELEKFAKKCVQYVRCRSHTNIPIKRNEFEEHVLANTKTNFEAIIEKASEILDKVYGFKLVACTEPDSNISSYVTVQSHEDQSTSYDPNEEIPSDSYKILIMFVLTNIFMSETPVIEADMFTFLSTAGINVDDHNGMFGNVKEFVNKTMVEQNYIVLLTDPVSKEITYKWGARSEKTISKHKILQFMSAIYGGVDPTYWAWQYVNAIIQSDDNEAPPNPEENVDVEVV